MRSAGRLTGINLAQPAQPDDPAMNPVESQVRQIAAHFDSVGCGTLYGIVARHGKGMMSEPLPAEILEFIAPLKRRFRPRARQCYMNAQRLVVEDWQGARGRRRLRYWEGWFADEHVPHLAHAWVTVDGRVWDATAEALEREYREKHGDPRPRGNPWYYFGVEIPPRLVMRNMVMTERYAPVLENRELMEELFPELVKKARKQ